MQQRVRAPERELAGVIDELEAQATREELVRTIADFLLDQTRQFPEATAPLRQLVVRVRSFDL